MENNKKVYVRSFPGILKKTKHLKMELNTKTVDEGTIQNNLNDPLPQGCSTLMYACQQGDYTSVVEILKADPSCVHKRDRGLRTALHYCADRGAQRVTCADRILMAAPELRDSRDADGLTPLHLAVIQGNVQLVQLLLASGADVHAVDNEMHTVLHWVTVCGEVGALRTVLQGGANTATPDKHGGYPLHYAAQMCGAPATLDHQGRGAALEVLRTLLREGGASAEVRDADGRTPLLWAASAGSAAAALALVRAGANIDDYDDDGLTALHCASSRGHTECMETLISLCGAKVDSFDTNGCTPLHYAVTLGHADATAVLLHHGAETNRQDKKGRTPAHCGAAKGQIQTVRMLGARGADLWLRNSRGDLPLHEAVSSGRRELVKWLIDLRPSQVNASNNDGRTPLHVAAAAELSDVCRLLLDQGAKINALARNSSGQSVTPLDCAISKGHRSTAKFLQAHGGVPASRLNHNNIIDNVKITSMLPGRHTTSTTIDVHDKIRIEKKEIYEPDYKKHIFSDSSSSSDENQPCHRQLPQISDSNDLFYQRNKHRIKKRNEKRENIRSRSEPSGENKTRKKCRRKAYRHYSESDGSSSCHCRKRSYEKSTRKKESSSASAFSIEGNHTSKISNRQQTVVEITGSEKKSKVCVLGTNIEVEYSDCKDEITVEKSSQATVPEDSSNITDSEPIKESVTTLADVHHNNALSFESNSPKEKVIPDEHLIHSIKEIPQENQSLNKNQYENDKQTINKKHEDHRIDKVAESEESNMTQPKNQMLSAEENQITIPKLRKEPSKSILKNASKIENESPCPKADSFLVTDFEKSSTIDQESMCKNDPPNRDPKPHSNLNDTVAPENPEINKSDTIQTLNENYRNGERKKSFEILTSPGYMIKEIITSEHDCTYNDESRNEKSSEVTGDLSENQPEHEKRKLLEERTASSFDTKTEDNAKNTTEESGGKVMQIESLGIENIDKSPKSSRKHSKDDSRKGSIYETESYKVLSDVGTNLQEDLSDDDKEPIMQSNRFIKENSFAKIPSVSDNELYNKIDANGRRKRLKKRNKTKTKSSTLRSTSVNSERGYESSGIIDSGFGPSPRIVQTRKIASPRLRAYYQQRNGGGKYLENTSKIPVRKPGDRNAVDMQSVTQQIQTNMRRYFCERKIFHFLHELKRLQIRSSKTTEAVLVKRAIDEYNKSSLTHVGMGSYTNADFTFSSFEKFLYESLRKLQKSGKKHLENLPENPSFDYGDFDYRMSDIPSNPALCTSKTHRCFHAVHTYTGIPCSAYITPLNHHYMPKPGKRPSFLPKIGSTNKPHITLEVSHGTDKQLIALPSEQLEKNKKYYVTFTVKGSNVSSDHETVKKKSI